MSRDAHSGPPEAMILGNRRFRTIYVALAGMDVACLLPYVLTWIERGRTWTDFTLPAAAAYALDQPIVLFLFWWILMLGYLLVADLINRQDLSSPRRELAIILLVIATSVAGIRMLLYPPNHFTDGSWIGETVRSVLDFSDGVTPPLLFILMNTFLWIRVAIAADREITFFGVGVSFRLGMLFSIVGGALLSTVGGRSVAEATLYFMIFFGLGLVAIALARIDEKAVGDTHSVGTTVPFTRLAETAVLALVILSAAYVVQGILKPSDVRRAFSLLDPLWNFVAWVLATVLLAVFALVGPLLDRIVLALQRMMSEVEPVQTEAGPPAPIDFADMETVLRDWTWLRYTLVIAAVLAVIALLWFLFVQSDEEISQSEEQEPEQAEQRTQLAPGMPDFARLRDWLNLLRHYGVGRRLLNAISVENMYANLGRMARSRGYPRLPSQPPDAYLAQLRLAFPGQNAQLERMTAAYMRVHYGDLPVEEHEMRSLRDDYDQIKEAPEPDTYAT